MTEAGKRIRAVTGAILGEPIAIGTIRAEFGGAHVIYAGCGEWLPCDGRQVLPDEYPELSAICDEYNWNGCVPDFES